MHAEALEFVRRSLPPIVGSVVEFGSRDINGSPRSLMGEGVDYVGVDIRPGKGVDIVADCALESVLAKLGRAFDVCVCAEVFEHTPAWPWIVRNAASVLRPGGVFVATMAMHPRIAHSAFHGGALESNEWYENVSAEELEATVTKYFRDSTLETHPDRGDLYVRAVR